MTLGYLGQAANSRLATGTWMQQGRFVHHDNDMDKAVSAVYEGCWHGVPPCTD